MATTGSPDAHTMSPVWATNAVDNLAEGLQALDMYKKKDPNKGTPTSELPRASRAELCVVVVRFKAVGNAPIMKQNFFKVTVSNRFQAVIQFLRKELGWKAGDPLVRFVLRLHF